MYPIKTVVKAAAIVGTLDITAALLQVYARTGKPPFRPVLFFVASGLLGKSAFTSGDAMMVVGLLIHYCVATAFTVFFFVTIAKSGFVQQQPLLAGLLYGAIVWVVMNLLVLPVTAAPPLPKSFSSIAAGMGILMICIGIPLAFLARKKGTGQRAIA